MTTGWLAIALGVSTAVALALLARARREQRQLRERIESATRELQNLQMSFSRFTPEEVIERVIAEGIDDRGEKKEVTVLFADIMGFTALSEAVEPSVLLRILNGYFERMSEAIAKHRGHVATFIGDGLLAFFGAHAPNPWQANDAVHAALEMRASLTSYNEELEREGLPTLRIGVGLHRGTGVAGLVGSSDLKEFAFVGRTVNVAARVAAQTHGSQLLMTAAVRAAVDPIDGLVDLGEFELRNVSEPVQLFDHPLGLDHGIAGVDPVCRMRVERDQAAGRLRHDGVDHWFCSLRCAAMFASAPDQHRS